MKPCAEVEPLLYVYTELSVAEKTLADKHLTGCNDCRMLFESTQENKAWINQAAQVQVAPPHAGRLTSNIMAAIGQPNKQTVSWLNNVALKYAMLAASFGLILIFGMEQTVPVTVRHKTASSSTATLHSASLAQTFLNRKENPQSEKLSLYACAKSESCENEIIKNLKPKISG